MTYSSRAALRQYTQVNTETEITTASPHRLIQMLYEGALESITKARGHMVRQQVADKCTQISKALAIIVDGLEASLNLEAGGEIAENLAALYDYMARQLVEANIRNSPDILDEVHRLLSEIKEGWDGIAPEVGASS